MKPQQSERFLEALEYHGLSRRDFLLWLSTVSAGAVAAACAPTPAPAPPAAKEASPAAAPTPAPKKPVQLTKVRAAVITGLLENLFQITGVDKGFYKDHGVDIQFTEITQGGTMNKALVAGELEVAETGAGPLIAAISQGASLKLIGATKPKLNFVLFARKEINKLEDLYGKNVGTAEVGSQLHVVMLALLSLKGLDAKKVQFVNVGASPAVYRAVEAGKVDAGVATIDLLPAAERSPDVKPLVYFAREIPQYFRVGVATADAILKDKKELLVNTMTAWARSMRYAIEHKDEFVQLAVTAQKRNPDDVSFAFDYLTKNHIINPDLDFDPTAVKYLQELNIMIGSQKEVLPFEKVADLSIQQAAIANLGKYQWKV